ncbi:MAG: YncE family protein, partial [Geobacter sp.]|nr:YncE family protein [Geobacter sp.]
MLIRHACNTLISCIFISVLFLFSSNLAAAHMIKATVAGNPADYIGYNGVTGKVYAVSSGSSTVQVFNSYSSSSTTITLPNSGPLNAVVNQNNNKIYTRHFTSTGGVTVIDGVTNSTTYVSTGMNPSGIALNTATNKLYVANSGSNTVSVIDGSTNLLITNINVGSNPQAVAIDSSRNRIYVANATSYTVSIIDGSSDTVIPTPITVGTFPYRLAVNEITNRIYVANNSSNDVSIIDGSTLSVTATVAVGTNPTSVGIDTLNNLAYIANSNSAFTSVIRGIDNSVYQIPFNAISFAVNQSTGISYLANSNNPAILPIADGSTGSYSVFRPPTPVNEIALDSSKNTAYLATSTGILILDSNQYALTTSTYSPDFGSGTVAATPSGSILSAGTVVTLQAAPALGSYFSGWSGACTGNLSLTCKLTMDGVKAATANFTTTPPTAATWSKSLGNPSTDDSFKAVRQTADGGYVMAGSYGYNGGVSQDFWVVKMNSDGTVAWQKSYNGSYDSFSLNGNESANSIQQTADGGYILAGTTMINGGSRGWLLRLDSLGNNLWNRPIGADDASYSSFSSVQQTSDGGFIASGSANSNIWLVKTTSTGVIEWQKEVLSGAGNSVVQTSDDGYIVAGGTLLTKFSANGSAVWQSQLSGVTMTSVVQNLDGSYAAGGYSAVASAGGNDVWVAKIDATGANIIWQKSLGGSGNEYGTSLQQTTDGGYIVGGYSDALGAGLQDILLIKLDATGALQGSHTYGGTSFDSGAAVQQTADGGIILVGQTYVGTATYKNDGWAMKLDATGMMTGCEASAILTPALTVVDPGITIVQSATSSGNVTNKFAATFSTAPIDTSVAAVSGSVCYVTSYPVDGKLTVVPGNTQVELFWTPATSAIGITFYKVAKGINGFSLLTDCSTGVDVGNVTSYLDNTPPLINDQKYYYRVCAVDAFTAVSAGVTASATPSATLNSLTVIKSGTGSGKVSSIAGNLDCGVVCANNYPTGSVVTLTAAPAAGSYFNGWSGACAGTSSLTCKVTMTAAANITADFITTPPASVPTWSKVLHSSGVDIAWAVRETADGGAVIAGEKNSAAWIIKLTSSGSIQWQNTYGNAGYYRINDIQLAADGGYITAGTGSSSSWIMNLAADGSINWENTYIGVYPGEAYSAQQTSDGGYIFTGYLSPGISNIDALVVKLDAAGNVSWDKTYGSSTGGEYAYSIRQTADGGYIVGGKIETAFITYDAWAMKLFTDGSIDWQKRFNINSYYSQINSIEPASDGGFIAVGKNNLDAWIVKLGGFGSLQWQNSYNHFGNQGAGSVVEASDGSYVFASKGALASVSSDGTSLLWQRDYAYVNGDALHSVQATADGGYIAVGASGASIDSDIWLLKTDTNGFISGWTRSITSTFSTTAVSPTDTTFTYTPA